MRCTHFFLALVCAASLVCLAGLAPALATSPSLNDPLNTNPQGLTALEDTDMQKNILLNAFTATVEKATGQPLQMVSAPTVHIYPNPSLELGPSAWGDSSSKVVLSFNKALLQLNAKDLLRGKLRVEGLNIEGLQVHLYPERPGNFPKASLNPKDSALSTNKTTALINAILAYAPVNLNLSSATIFVHSTAYGDYSLHQASVNLQNLKANATASLKLTGALSNTTELSANAPQLNVEGTLTPSPTELRFDIKKSLTASANSPTSSASPTSLLQAKAKGSIALPTEKISLDLSADFPDLAECTTLLLRRDLLTGAATLQAKLSCVLPSPKNTLDGTLALSSQALLIDWAKLPQFSAYMAPLLTLKVLPTKHSFDSASLQATITSGIISPTLALTSPTLGATATGQINLPAEALNINAYILHPNQSPLPLSVSGSLHSPKVSVDTKAALQTLLNTLQ